MADSPKNNNIIEEKVIEETVIEEPIIEKKKRGRKPKPKPLNPEPKVAKKRGRKPKLKLVSQEDKNKFVLPSKRGRKPKDKTIILDKNLNLDNISNVILHLPIPLEKLNDLDEKLSFKYETKINNPDPFDPGEENTAYIEEKKDSNCIYEVVDNENEENKIVYNEYIDNYYDNKKDINNVKCNWCLHSCDEEIIRLPYNINNDVFNMHGSFCCPECAAAYNFNELNDEYMWERYSLLNYIYNNNGEKYNIAPSRLVLDIFGGPLSIKEYKDIIKTKKNVNVIMPPLCVLKPQIEVNKVDDIYIPLNVNRVKKYTTDLKLKRNKLKTKTNTLDLCMNLKCGN